jgi:hypothetical protein
MPHPNTLATAIATSLLMLAAAAAHAQTPIQLDRPVSGALSASSPKADDGTPYDLYVYRGRAGERVRISMDSSAFDAYLAVGTVAAPGCPGDCKTDDDGGEGTNSSTVYTVPAGGQLQIRANSISATDAGPYTLTVTALPPPAAVRVRPARLNQPIAGTLGETSSVDDADKPFDLYSIDGSAGQRLQIRMESSAFDSYLEFGSMVDGVFVGTAYDDDGGSNLDSRLNATLDASGKAVVKATSASGGVSGAYTLYIGDPPAQRPIQVVPAVVGEAVRGRLDDADPFDPDNEHRFDVYSIEGRPGQRIMVRLESSDFDPVLRWGTFDGDRFMQDATDDDGGGGTSAQLTVTLDADGLGRLVATSLDGSTGSYTMTVVGAPRP